MTAATVDGPSGHDEGSGPDLAAAWRDLVAAALLGTDRSGGQPVDLPGPVREAAAAVGLALDDGGPASLLAAAALLDVARSAGTRHETAVSAAAAGSEAADLAGARLAVVDPAPTETRPVARTSEATVVRLLAGGREDLHEWLDLVRDRGLVVPPAALPGLLRVAVTDGAVRAAAGDVVGARGAWLAGFEPGFAPLVAAWAPGAPGSGGAGVDGAVGDDSGATADDGADDTADGADVVWRLGDLPARVRWLATERRRDPAAARDVLVAALPGLPAAERADLLAALGAGLGPDDEPLLERALDDRAAAVRRTAAALLADLPGSALLARARERAAPLVQAGRVGLRRGLHVTLPEQPHDAAALRDGLSEPQGTQAGVVGGRRAQRLHQLLAAAPLDTWVPALARTPEDLVRLPVADDRGDLLHAAWAAAAVRGQDPGWAAALVPRVAEPGPLVPLLPPPVRARVVDALLRGPVERRHAALPALDGWPRPWPDEVTDSVVAAVRRTPVVAYGDRTWAQHLASLLGRRADPLRTVVDPGENPLLQHAVARLAERRQTSEETTA